MNNFDSFFALPKGIQILIACAAVVQVILLILSVRSISKTPAESLTLPKPAWLAIVIVTGIVGSIVYFKEGRRFEIDEMEHSAESRKHKTQSVIDSLYQD